MLDGFGGEINEVARRIAQKSKQGTSSEVQKKSDLFKDSQFSNRTNGRERMTKRLGKAATFVLRCVRRSAPETTSKQSAWENTG